MTSDDAMSLWRRTVEAMLAKGCSPAESLDAANLITAAYQRQRTGHDALPLQHEEVSRESGERLVRHAPSPPGHAPTALSRNAPAGRTGNGRS